MEDIAVTFFPLRWREPPSRDATQPRLRQSSRKEMEMVPTMAAGGRSFSPFEALVRTNFDRLLEFMKRDSFTFWVNGADFTSTIAEALCKRIRGTQTFQLHQGTQTFPDEFSEEIWQEIVSHLKGLSPTARPLRLSSFLGITYPAKNFISR